MSTIEITEEIKMEVYEKFLKQFCSFEEVENYIEKQPDGKLLVKVDEAKKQYLIKNGIMNSQSLSSESYTASKKLEAELELLKKQQKEKETLLLIESFGAFANKELSKVKGQDEIIASIKPKLFTTVLEGYHKIKNQPTTFFFSGNSRMGKTFLAEKIGNILSKRSLVIPMSNFTSDAHLTALTGTSAGWKGYDEKTIIENYMEECEKENKDRYVLVFDEIEKADKSLSKFFLELLSTGKITLLNGKILDLRNSVIIFTSNLGAKILKKKIGFDNEEIVEKVNGLTEKVDNELVIETIKNHFPPEFINRVGLNNIFVFNDLSTKAKESILLENITDSINKLKGKVDMNIKSVRMKIFNKLKKQLAEDNIGNLMKDINHEILSEAYKEKMTF